MYGYGYSYNVRPNAATVFGFNPATAANTIGFFDPSVSTSVNLGSPTDTDPIDNLADLSSAGNDAPQEVVARQPEWKTTYMNFDTDALKLDAVQADFMSATQGTIIVRCNPDDGTPTAIERIYSFADTSGANDYFLFQIQTDGKIKVVFRVGGVNQWVLDTDNAVMSTATWAELALVQDAVSPVLYVDNVAVAQTLSTSTDTTAWFNDFTDVDNGKLGALQFNGVAEGSYFQGTFQAAYFSTDAKDASWLANFNAYNPIS